MMKVETPGPLLGGSSRASENGVSEGNAGRRCPKQAEACFGMPLGAVAQRLGDRREGPGVPGPGVRLPLLPRGESIGFPVAFFVMVKSETPGP